MVLFGTEDSADVHVAKAALIVAEAIAERFLADPFAYLGGINGDEPVHHFNGVAESSPAMSCMAKRSMQDGGLTLSPNLCIVRPFWAGREAGLAPDPNIAAEARTISLGFAATLAPIRLVKFVRKRKRASCATCRQRSCRS